MARICSFHIDYNNQSFPTLVSVASHELTIVCTVHFVERKIRYLEPGDKLVYCKEHGLLQPRNLPRELSQEINRCIQEWIVGSSASRA